MIIFTLLALGNYAMFMSSEEAKKRRNPLLKTLGDGASNLVDMNKHFAKIAKNQFGLEYAPGISMFESFFNFYYLHEELSAASSNDSFKLNSAETSAALKSLYSEHLSELTNGNFDAFFDQAIAIQRKNFAYLLGENLKQKNVIENLSWSSRIYIAIANTFAKLSGKDSKHSQEFQQRIAAFISTATGEANIYNYFERLFKQTEIELKKELQILADDTLALPSKMSEEEHQFLTSKTLLITNIISNIETVDQKDLYFEFARYLINSRVALHKEALKNDKLTLRIDINQWAVSMINTLLKKLVEIFEVDAAFELIQKMLNKELPFFANRYAFGDLVSQIPEIDSIFEFDYRENPAEHLYKVFVLNTLILSGKSYFSTTENKKKAIDAFSQLAYASFRHNNFLHQVSPILFNNIVADNNSVEFVNALFKYIASATINSVIHNDFTNVFEVLDEIIDEKIFESPSKFYVPAKVANFLMAHVYSKDFALKFQSSNKVISELKEVLNSDEFAKLNVLVQHWWAKQFNFQVHEEQIESQEFVESWLKTKSFYFSDFSGIVKIGFTDDKQVFDFNVSDFDYNFIEEEIIVDDTEEETKVPEFTQQIQEDFPEQLGEMLARKQRTEPPVDRRRGPQLFEEDEEEEDVNEDHVNQESVQDEEKNTIVQVLRGHLKSSEYDLLSQNNDLIDTLKNGYSFIADDGVPVEITYAQVVDYNSDCYKQIKALRA